MLAPARRLQLVSMLALLGLSACGHDWDSYDPRPGGAGGVTSATSSSSQGGGTGGSAAGGGLGGGSASTASSGSGGLGTGGGALGYRDVVLSDAPAAYWRLGDSPGDDAADEVQPGIVGAYVDGVLQGVPGAIVGDSNTAARFDGIDDQIVFGDVFDFAGVTPMSVEAWIDPDDPQPTGRCCAMIVCKQATVYIGWELGLAGEPQGVSLNRELDPVFEDIADAIPSSGFVHVVGTFDGSSLRLYINGELAAEGPSTVLLPDHDAPLRIGGSDGNEPFAGVIDEVAIYVGVLSEERVLSHYVAGSQ